MPFAHHVLILWVNWVSFSFNVINMALIPVILRGFDMLIEFCVNAAFHDQISHCCLISGITIKGYWERLNFSTKFNNLGFHRSLWFAIIDDRFIWAAVDIHAGFSFLRLRDLQLSLIPNTPSKRAKAFADCAVMSDQSSCCFKPIWVSFSAERKRTMISD